VSELPHNSASCIAVPSVQRRGPPVLISLKNATLGTIFTPSEFVAPFYLWGDTTAATGDVHKNKKPLPKGTYYLDSRVDGIFDRIKFTTTC
jgi:hypothetical protein